MKVKVLFYFLPFLALSLVGFAPFYFPKLYFFQPFVPSRPLFPKTEQDQNQNGIPDRYELALAKKFNPAMGFYGDSIWPVDHRYLWSQGSPLKRRVYRKKGWFWKYERTEILLPASELSERAWAYYPDREGDFLYKYYIDGPGENLGPGAKEMSWEKEFRRIQGEWRNPQKAAFPPTQYAHFYWKDWKKGLLVIQYWFYYPFNKYINNHEGDWEHINVVLKLEGEGEERFRPDLPLQRPLWYEYYFHQFHIRLATPTRIGDKKGGDHPLVLVGGKGELWIPRIQNKLGWWNPFPLYYDRWEGNYSGGSYPFLGYYESTGGQGIFRKSEEIPRIERWIHPGEFQIILLDEPWAVDYQKHPELSWLNLDFYSGNWDDQYNNFVLQMAGAGIAPLQPARKTTWNSRLPRPQWNLWSASRLRLANPPKHWKILHPGSIPK